MYANTVKHACIYRPFETYKHTCDKCLNFEVLISGT